MDFVQLFLLFVNFLLVCLRDETVIFTWGETSNLKSLYISSFVRILAKSAGDDLIYEMILVLKEVKFFRVPFRDFFS